MGVQVSVKHLYDQATNTLTYIVFDPDSRDAVVIDSVLDFDPASGKIDLASVERVVDALAVDNLKPIYILETHAHADHLSGAHTLKTRHYPKVKLGIGGQITVVQMTFKDLFNFGDDFDTSGQDFDQLFQHGETFTAGTLEIKVMNVPGHTPACVAYRVGEHVFTGDAIFMPDAGTGRCDFPKGSAEILYESITEHLYTLPDSTALYVGHDYQPGGRELRFKTTVDEQKRTNKHLTATTTKEEFVKFRSERDAELSAPRLLFPSIQINCRAGQLPPAESNGRVYLKLPITLE